MRLSLRDRFASIDPVITGLVFGLTIFGLAVLMSATGPVAFQRTADSLFFVKRQFLQGVLPGAFLFALFAVIDYRIWKKLAVFFLIATFVLLAMVYIPNVGVVIGGARSWVDLGPLRFQPSEIVKFTFLIYIAAWLAERKGRAHDLKEGVMPFIGILGAVIFLLVVQPDTGTMAVVAATSLTMYLISGAPLAWFVLLALSGVGLVAFLIKISPYRAARFMTFLHPELDPKGIGYHINQAILAIGSGGVLGLGFGKSRQKYLYLPEVEADSIFAVMAEELGFIVILLFLSAYGFLIWRCFKIARDCRDEFGTFLAAGVGAWIGFQALINIMSMTGLMPMTGVTLPFISHGGTSLTIMLAACGLVAGIPATNRKRL